MSEWAKEVAENVVKKLKLPLLRMDPAVPGSVGEILAVNFHPLLVRMLREVAYFIKMGLEVPDTAMGIFKKAETFRNQTGNLEIMATKNNWIQAHMLDVEKPLVAKELDEIKDFLQIGMRDLNWQSMGISDFVKEASTMVKGVEHVLLTLKDNVTKMQAVLHPFTSPLFKFEVMNLGISELEVVQEGFDAARDEKQEAFGEASEQVHELAKNSMKAVRVNKAATTWKVSYIYILVLSDTWTHNACWCVGVRRLSQFNHCTQACRGDRKLSEDSFTTN